MQGLILVIEDEADLATTLEYNLQKEGYATRVSQTGQGGLDAAGQDPLPDAIVLDLMLPDVSGTEVCRRLRENERTRDIPIIMCTAKGSEIDRVVGFEVGADDYVVKPFSMRELLLRVRARLVEVSARGTPASAAPLPQNFTMGPLTIDSETHRVLVDGREVSVSLLEMQLLVHLAKAKGAVCSRRDLLTHVWKYSAGVTSRTVDTHVKRLRDKLGSAGHLIRTIRGVGYRLA